MTKEELKKIRQSLGFSQVQFGILLNYAKKSARYRIRELESGERTLSKDKEFRLYHLTNRDAIKCLKKFNEGKINKGS